MFWDTPRGPVITHTSDSHQIPSQNKTSKLHILNSVRARIITGSQKVSPRDSGGLKKSESHYRKSESWLDNATFSNNREQQVGTKWRKQENISFSVRRRLAAPGCW